MDNHEFNRDEFKESYAHYRHLEQERSRHLRFFLVIVGALLGVLGFSTKAAASVADRGSFLFVCGLVVVFLQILDTVTFAAIRRVGAARGNHAKTIRHLRSKLASDEYVANLWAAFDDRPHLSVQRAAEIMLHLFALILVLAASLGTIYGLNSGIALWWQGIVVLFLTLFFAVVHIGLSIYPKSPEGKSHLTTA